MKIADDAGNPCPTSVYRYMQDKAMWADHDRRRLTMRVGQI